MNNYQEKYKSISTEKMLSTQDTKGYQKLRRLVRWYLYLLSYAYNFCKENKTTMFYWLWKLKSNTLINNHFIIKYKVYGMVTRRNPTPFNSVIFHNVIFFSMFYEKEC